MGVEWNEDLHPRDENGKFSSSGGGLGRAATRVEEERRRSDTRSLRRLGAAKGRALYERALTDGGFTYDAVNDSFPTKGFAVSIYPEHEEVHRGKVTPEQMAGYLERKRFFMEKNPGAHFGVWYDSDADKWYFDLSHVAVTRDEGVALARKYNQEGIYDLEAHQTIITKAASERRIDSPPL